MQKIIHWSFKLINLLLKGEITLTFNINNQLFFSITEENWAMFCTCTWETKHWHFWTIVSYLHSCIFHHINMLKSLKLLYMTKRMLKKVFFMNYWYIEGCITILVLFSSLCFLKIIWKYVRCTDMYVLVCRLVRSNDVHFNFLTVLILMQIWEE